MKYCCYLFLFFLALPARAQRTTFPLNEGWKFVKGDAAMPGANASWQQVKLPHTWNAEDVMDDEPGYYRGIGWYKRKIQLDGSWRGKELYLYFDGANQQTAVFINGAPAGTHIGGYTAFSVPISHLLDWNKDNEIEVKVDNAPDLNIPPLSADFSFYGGIYRELSLVVVEPVHFSCDDHGSSSVFISTPLVNDQTASVRVNATIANSSSAEKKLSIITIVRDATGKKIADISGDLVLEGATQRKVEQMINAIPHPRLWSPADPYLYKVITTIVNQDGEVLDEITNRLGFRWFHFDGGKGFFLNGVACKLVGTSRHQDYKGLGNAVPAQLARADVGWLKKMGGNFLRVSHYPQDQAVLEACDSLGILASVEIPVVNEITESDSFFNNCYTMQLEMIRQNRNHPSVIAWCYMNEVLLRSHFNKEKDRQKIYYASVAKLASGLDSITRAEDPFRYTMIAYHGDYAKYNAAGLLDIPMIVGWNLYSGWYGSSLKDFPAFLDTFHKNHPDKPMLVSEYGADADPRVRSVHPVRFDKSVEYSTRFHHYYLAEMLKRPFVSAAMIWNLADFNSETRNESMPHINNKGLLTWDRVPKDPYYYYEAMLLPTPFIKILGATAGEGVADSTGNSCQRLVQVTANTKDVELFINGRSAGRQPVDNGLCEWSIPLINGDNILEARGKRDGKIYTDKTRIKFCLHPYRFNAAYPFRQMNILLGADRYFTDDEQRIWIPDQEYRQGSWGSTGGKALKIAGNSRLPYGTDKNIIGTDNDPVYQTQRMGIENYRMDLPAGEYELTLYFAELLGGAVKGNPYNLAEGDRIEPNGRRIFDVSVNGKLFLGSFDIAGQYGTATAVTKMIKVDVKNDKGLTIDFKAIEGQPVLNAISIKRASANQIPVSGPSQ